MGPKISKCYFYSFHPMSAKFYEDVAYHPGIQAIFLGNKLYFLIKNVALQKFNIGVNGKS